VIIELSINSEYSLKLKRIHDFEQAEKVLSERTYKTYKLKGLSSLRFNEYGDLTIGYEVVDTDKNGFNEFSSEYTERLFTPKHCWNHLVGMLGLPNSLYDYYELFKKLGKTQTEICLEHESDILKMFFEYREADKLERETLKKGHYLKDHYLSVFTDTFGTFPRVIRSELYKPYSDYQALVDTNDNLMLYNEKKGSDFEFQKANYSPYRFSVDYIDNNKKIELKEVGDTVCNGLRMFNSETKDSSYGFQSLMVRLQCTNGMVSNFSDTALRVKHIGKDFERNTLLALQKVLELSNEFMDNYTNLEKYSKPITNNWNELLQMDSSVISLNNKEKLNLIDIAEKEDYVFSSYGLVQALTYEGSHNSRTDKDVKRNNTKSLEIMNNPKALGKWYLNKHKNDKKDETDKNIISTDSMSLSLD